MSANDELVANFREVTGIDEQRARFYLESSGWQLEVTHVNKLIELPVD